MLAQSLAPIFIVFVTHYVSSNVYASVCTPCTLVGFLQSLVVTGSPFCGVLMQIMQTTQSHYGILVVGVGTAMMHQLTMRCDHTRKESRHSK